MRSGSLVSVIVCTYNRAEYLKNCLDSLLKQTCNNIEVIVVNGSGDNNTEEVLKDYPFKVIEGQDRIGLSVARNIGIDSAKGEIVAFIDDDAVADNDWLEELSKCYTEKEIVSVGGRIEPIWHKEKPDWYTERLNVYLSLLDLSQEAGQIVFPDMPFGCNMSFRRNVFKEIGYFNPSLGRSPSRFLSYEETELYKRIDKKGYTTMYNPKAVVYHQINASRLTKDYFNKRAYWDGISYAIFHKHNYNTNYLFRMIAKNLCLSIPYILAHYFFIGFKKREGKLYLWKLELLSNLGYVKSGLYILFWKGGRE